MSTGIVEIIKLKLADEVAETFTVTSATDAIVAHLKPIVTKFIETEFTQRRAAFRAYVAEKLPTVGRRSVKILPQLRNLIWAHPRSARPFGKNPPVSMDPSILSFLVCSYLLGITHPEAAAYRKRQECDLRLQLISNYLQNFAEIKATSDLLSTRNVVAFRGRFERYAEISESFGDEVALHDVRTWADVVTVERAAVAQYTAGREDSTGCRRPDRSSEPGGRCKIECACHSRCIWFYSDGIQGLW